MVERAWFCGTVENHRNAEWDGCRAAIEPRESQMAVCGHLDPKVLLEVVVSKMGPLPAAEEGCNYILSACVFACITNASEG